MRCSFPGDGPWRRSWVGYFSAGRWPDRGQAEHWTLGPRSPKASVWFVARAREPATDRSGCKTRLGLVEH